MILLLTLLAGVVDLGRAAFTYAILTDAAQEGVVYGSFCPADTTGMLERIRQSASSPVDLSTAAITMNCSYIDSDTANETTCASGTPEVGDYVKLEVVMSDFRMVMPFIGTIIGTQSLTLRGESQSPILTVSCPTN